ncbi:MAG TPA: response regulator transcription factor [Nocardioides sp.]|uniref:response regulator transcription factor n=1 Tax=Nocardioides sp. TaxID=35761 RepID=UPI002F3F3480
MPQATAESRRPIRVALSNDYEIALLGLAQMLARYPSKVQIVDLTTLAAVPHRADIILYDTFGRLPDNDIKLRKIVESNSAKVVVYSWEEYPEEAARRHGAVGYLHKGLSADELVAAVVAIHEDREPTAAPHTEEPDLTWPGQPFGLTQRESEMLTFITRGLTNDEIVRRSYLSINTVKSYIRSAYRKIGVRTRPQAVAWGYRNGFQSTDDVGL